MKKNTNHFVHLTKSCRKKQPFCLLYPENKQNFFYHNHFQIEEEIKTILTEAQDLAYQVLTREKKLLLTMANYLSDNRMLRNSDIEAMINNHATGNKPVNTFQHFAYRTFLKQALKATQNKGKVFNVVMLNREGYQTACNAEIGECQ